MQFTNLLVEIESNIATVTFNRPKALNALNQETMQEALACFQELKNNDMVQVVIVTGSGTKAFVAGGDIAFMRELTPLTARKFGLLGQVLTNTIEGLGKPVVAAVNGFALGGGCELALACDIRLASDNAKFGQPEVNLGVIPGFGGTQRLPRLIGRGRASELIFTGDIIDAQEA
jgi:enoyl-CoA hydratase